MKVGVLGSGVVGQTLASGFLEHGYGVVVGSSHPEKLKDWQSNVGKNAQIGSFQEAAEHGKLVILAVKGLAAEEIVTQIEPQIRGKTVIDVTNPLADAAPDDGVLKVFTASNESLMEKLQTIAPDANFVKAFNSVSSAVMVNPDFGGTMPSMFICGKNEAAKTAVREILNKFGWETQDMGMPAAARAIEQLTVLYCIPGLLHNQWSHAFKLLPKT